MKLDFLKKWNIKELLLVSLFLIVIFVNAADFIEDGINQEDSWVKILTIALSLWGIITLLRLMTYRSDEISGLHLRVSETENNLDLIHLKLKQIGSEYSKYLYKQFEIWKLSPSEQEIAIILLKGLSFKEIATVRNTKEKTVRQQASMIYKKANVTGRHEFSAWFFEDMLV